MRRFGATHIGPPNRRETARIRPMPTPVRPSSGQHVSMNKRAQFRFVVTGVHVPILKRTRNGILNQCHLTSPRRSSPPPVWALDSFPLPRRCQKKCFRRRQARDSVRCRRSRAQRPHRRSHDHGAKQERTRESLRQCPRTRERSSQKRGLVATRVGRTVHRSRRYALRATG